MRIPNKPAADLSPWSCFPVFTLSTLVLISAPAVLLLKEAASAAVAAASPLAIKAHKACYLEQWVIILLLNLAAPVPG